MSRAVRTTQGFWHERDAGVAVPTALTVSLLILAFAGLMEIVHSAHGTDRMARAARAAARAVALLPDRAASQTTLDSVACAAIRTELDLDAQFNCGTTWTLSVVGSIAPQALVDGAAGGNGDLVVVRIAWDRAPWQLGRLLGESNGGQADATREFAVAVARHESERGS